MAKLMILYGHPADPAAFEDYCDGRSTIADLASYATGGAALPIVEDDA